MSRRYRVGEVAKMAGVSIRTLHHYDEIGLLKPAGQTDSGYRLYENEHLFRLQQILMLRLLGFPLAHIRELLDRNDFDLAAALRIQRQALRDRITELQKIEDLIQQLLLNRLASDEWDWHLVEASTEAIGSGLQLGSNTMEDRFTPEQMEQFRQLGERLGPDAIQQTENHWAELLNEVRAAGDLDPASAEAQELVARWDAFHSDLREAYASEPGLWEAIGDNYQSGAFADNPYAPTPDDYARIQRFRDAKPDES